MSNRFAINALLLSLLVIATLLLPAATRAQAPTSQPSTMEAASDAKPVVFPDHLVSVADKPRIVLLGMEQFPKESWAAVERHTAAELRAAGLIVVRARSTATELKERIDELGDQAKAHRAIGSVRVIRRDQRAAAVQVWVYDAVTKKVLLREAAVPEQAVDHSLDLAKQVVELLNASLIEIRMRRQRPIERVPPLVRRMVADRLPDPPAATPNRWALSLAPAFSIAPGGAGAGLGLLVGGDARLWRWLTLRAQLRLPLVAQQLEDEGVEATIRTYGGRILLGVDPWRDASWSPTLAVGAGAQLVHAAGGRDDLSGQTASAELALQIGISRHLGSGFHVEALASLGVFFAEPMVLFAADRQVGVGPLAIDATLGVRWTP